MDLNVLICAIEDIINVSIISLNAIKPNSSIILSIGLTPKLPVTNWKIQRILGSKISKNMKGLLRSKIFFENIY